MSELILGMKSARMAADAKMKKHGGANMNISCTMVIEMLDAIESLKEEIAQLKQPQWVSVDTEPKDGEYLCLVDDIVTSWQEVLSYKRRTKTWHCNYVNGAYPPRVSAYMPLPTPPESK